jgi:NTE family protein
VALVLSGGGARGLAHAGVIEVLEKHQIPIDLIVGSSAGSIIGALYADDPRAGQLRQKIIALNKWDLLDLNWFSGVRMLWQLRGPVEGHALRRFLQKNIKAYHFNHLQIPLAVVTTDIHRGNAFVIRSGPLIPALHASSAVPMVFSPVRLYGRTLVDGGVASPVPVEVAKQFHPKIIIAVDIGTSPDYGPVKNAYQLGVRSLHIAYYKLAYWQNQQADVVIHPAIDQFSMFDDHANEEMYQAGRKAAEEAIPGIRRLLAMGAPAR